jgi:hypothetical protein
MRLHAIACDVLARPVYLCAARSPHAVDVTLLRRGLHAQPPRLRDRLQAEIDRAGAPADGAPAPDAIVLAYGLCGGATAGLEARTVPLVLPRAHDCITLFLGSRERYAREAASTPTYWYVRDQLERPGEAAAAGGAGSGVVLGPGGDPPAWAADTDAQVAELRAGYVARYGEDNADYLMEVLGAWRDHYRRGAYLALETDGASDAPAIARAEAERRGWDYARVEGDLVLLRRLLEGTWGDEMLVLNPGERLAMSYDDAVMKAVPAGG